MRKFLFGGLIAALITTSPAFALRIAMPNYNTAQKSAMAETVVVGKVTSIEAEPVQLEAFPGAKQKMSYKVAVIKIETPLLGAKNLTHLKVVFAPQAVEADPNGGAPAPGGRPIRGGGFGGPMAVTEGQEGLFFLTPHTAGSSFLVIPQGFNPVAQDAGDFKDAVASVKQISTTLADPLKALKAEKAEDRLAAAAVLIRKYRQGPMNGGETTEVAVPAEEAKLLVKAVLEADWTPVVRPQPGFDYQSTPSALAGMLGLSPGQNGIAKVTPKPGENYQVKWKEALDAWAKTGVEKFELKKIVAKPAKSEK